MFRLLRGRRTGRGAAYTGEGCKWNISERRRCGSRGGDFDFGPNYVSVVDTEGGELRLHNLDEGPGDAAPILLTHGEPSWRCNNAQFVLCAVFGKKGS